MNDESTADWYATLAEIRDRPIEDLLALDGELFALKAGHDSDDPDC